MIIATLIAFFSLIALLVVHEFGHFILAKTFGARVEEFGVGYPPRILGKKIGETIYSLNLIPFGAFVRIHGEEGGVEDYRSFSDKPLWQRFLIIIGGVVSFWIVAAILLSIVAGVWGLPTSLGTLGPYSWHEAPVQGVVSTAHLTTQIIRGWVLGLKNLLGVATLPQGVKFEMFGPVGILDLLGQYSQMGIKYFLFLFSYISIALALSNLLPIPALDGGKLVFLAIESLRGKAVSAKVEQNITATFFVALIILMIFVTLKFDIPRIF